MVNYEVNFLLVSVESYAKGFVSSRISHKMNIEMDEKNLPSSGDESDADFVPKEEEYNSDSKSEVSDFESSEDENKTTKTRKRKKRSKKGSKKAKTNNTEEEEEDKEVAEKKQEIDVDALWADFKKDVDKVETKKTAESSHDSSEKESSNDKSSNGLVETNPPDNKPKGGASFPNRSKGGGLSKVLSQIGKKDKMSTLQKSQLDWNKFKKNEGIEEEIKMYNRGKDGYLERQDFLQRTDLRQFEIEKDLRSARRKF